MSEPSDSTRLVVGIFVGGRGSRMGGAAKGLLKAPDSEATLLERLLGELRSAVPIAEVVLVGNADAYASFGLPTIADDPPAVGPLGGLIALLAYTQERRARWALALACDVPRLGRGVLARLSAEANDASAVVVEQDGVRNPLLARYTAVPSLAAARDALQAGTRSLQAVLDRLGGSVTTLALSAAEAATLKDWDSPEDME